MQQPENVEKYEPKIRALIEKGVVLFSPDTVFVGDEVDARRIEAGSIIHPGCRLRGTTTAIARGAVIGEEAPATIEDCQLGRDVRLKGGFFSGSTFLDGATVGSSAHIRPGTLLEEGANAAHSVGFKQTILFPYVTVGSLANFCDCLMAGGTGPKNHGEVGSSYIHFNFTPYQDKATASLLGDVPQGVMLDKPPIFLGGQGGIVGPARLAFGTVTAAGVICRDDVLEEGLLYTGRTGTTGRSTRTRSGARNGLARLFRNNFHYIGNVRALHAWYEIVRSRLMSADAGQEACRQGAVLRLQSILDERLNRLREVADSLGGAEAYDKLAEAWPGLERDLSAGSRSGVGSLDRDLFLSAWDEIPPSTPYPAAIALVDPSAKLAGTRWLQALVDEVVDLLPEGNVHADREDF
jgi:UDP-N-acetylglucosamine/UDP-N-acetylgalactosamine diphosphorylase